MYPDDSQRKPSLPWLTLLGIACLGYLAYHLATREEKREDAPSTNQATKQDQSQQKERRFAQLSRDIQPALEPGVQSAPQGAIVEEFSPAPGTQHELGMHDLGKLFEDAGSEEDRRAKFEALLQKLTVNNAKEMRRYVAGLPVESYEYKKFHYEWGKIGGKDAVMHGATTEKPDMSITLAGWARADPEAAMAWYDSLPKQNRNSYANQSHMMGGLLRGLTDASPEKGLKFYYKLEKANHRYTGRMASVLAGSLIQSMGAEETAAWTETLPPGRLRAVARTRVVWDLSKEDLPAALAWVEGFAHEGDAGPGVEAMAKAYVKRDIFGSVTWLENLDPGPAKRKGISAAYGYWGALEPDSAAEYLNGQPPSTDRDFAVNGFISGLVHKDPETALVWAEEIQSKSLREAALVRAGQRFLQIDEQAASEWIEGLTLSQNSKRRLEQMQELVRSRQAAEAAGK